MIISIVISNVSFTIEAWCAESGEDDSTENTINPVEEKENNKIPIIVERMAIIWFEITVFHVYWNIYKYIGMI